jgi:hypothetical protein
MPYTEAADEPNIIVDVEGVSNNHFDESRASAVGSCPS